MRRLVCPTAAPLLALLLALLLGSGCYDVQTPISYLCSPDHPSCPAGRHCSPAGVCVLAGHDGAVHDGEAGAQGDADAGPRCGDKLKNGAEQCDDTDLGGDSCESLCFGAGKLRCTKSCAYDTSGCALPGWVTIPKGTFFMGSPKDEPCRSTNDQALHKVTLTRAFEMQATEVTQKQFKALMSYNPSYHSIHGDDLPVDQVTWHAAAAFCNALSAQAGLTPCYVALGSGKACTPPDHLPCPADESCLASGCAKLEAAAAYQGQAIYGCPGYRLPCEAEWEQAYRAGGTSALYTGAITSCFGEDPRASAIGWYNYNVAQAGHWPLRPQRVATRQPNQRCLFDLAGNLWEWCHDGYAAPTSATQPSTDPVGPKASNYRVVRGGGFSDPPHRMRAGYRTGVPPAYQHAKHGFRCVRTR
jgi:formylglycine-generating enzyme required for sulfatase activity